MRPGRRRVWGHPSPAAAPAARKSSASAAPLPRHFSKPLLPRGRADDDPQRAWAGEGKARQFNPMKTTTEISTKPKTARSDCPAYLLARLQAIGTFSRTLPLKLAEDGLGRVALHLFLAIRTGRYLWHTHGILREFGHH